MDNETSEGIELGVTLVVTVATLLIMTILCGLSRQAYINRTNVITQQNELLACASWRELYKDEQPTSINGSSSPSTYVTIDNMCQWITAHYEDYHIIVVDSYNMWSPGYIDSTKVNIDKWAANWFPGTMNKSASRNIVQKITAANLVDTINSINITRGVKGWAEATRAQVFVYTTDDYFYHALDASSYFVEEYKGQQTFEENYALPKRATIVFAIQ